jgi:hypothetical protein
MKLTKTFIQMAMLISMLPPAVSASENGVLYTQISTNGLGLGYAKSLTNDIALREQFNSYNRSFSGDVGDFGAGVMDVQLKMTTFMVLGDWYPTDGNLRVTGGAVWNDNKITVNSTNATVGGRPGVAAIAEIKMANFLSPYLGVGYSTRPKDAKGLGFNFDFGLMFQNPIVNLRVAGNGVTQAEASAQLAKVKEAANKLKIMPVIGVGVSYGY